MQKQSKHLHIIDTRQGVGGTSLEKGYGDVRQYRPLFQAPSATPHDALFNIFQFHKTLFLTKNHNISQFFNSKYQILANFQFLILKIGRNPVQIVSTGAKSQFWKQHFVKKINSTSPQIWLWSILQAPIFGPLGRPHTRTQAKVGVPPGHTRLIITQKHNSTFVFN